MESPSSPHSDLDTPHAEGDTEVGAGAAKKPRWVDEPGLPTHTHPFPHTQPFYYDDDRENLDILEGPEAPIPAAADRGGDRGPRAAGGRPGARPDTGFEAACGDVFDVQDDVAPPPPCHTGPVLPP